MEEQPRFAADRMLGRLARWLRLLGFDALHRKELPGRRLLTLAAREGRVVLTRDRRLARVGARVPVLVIASDRFRDQLREVDRVYPLGGVRGRAPRCGDCNVAIESLDPAAVPASVPEYVRDTQSEFWRCPRCRRTFWAATHRERMAAEVAALSLRTPGAL
ncbi:MAG: hypothetical protein FJ144_12030 [Deltaproteobacteria bacterium]|nr:hypothetical protein [Deltaproteobacteria bacterium]